MFNARIGDVSGRGKLAGDMREIWMMQPRFEKRVGSAPFGLVQQERFRAAFDFMRLRADIGEVDEALADWWQEFSTGDDLQREDLVDQVRQETQKRARAPKMQRAPAPEGESNTRAAPSERQAAPDDAPAGAEFSDEAPRPKRRRRRRTGGSGTGESGEGAGAPRGDHPAD